MKTVFTRQIARADANPESPQRTQPEINIRELCTPSLTVFTQEQNELLVRQVYQYSQDLEGEDFHHHVLGLNESSNPFLASIIICITAEACVCLFLSGQDQISSLR